MSPSSVGRRAGAAAIVATLAGSAALLPGPPSFATPIDGDIGAYGSYFEPPGSDCHVDQSNDGDATRVFTPATGRRTARNATRFRTTPSGGSVVSAHGRTETATSGVTETSGGAFDTVRLTANHFARVTDDTSSDCGLRVIAWSLGSIRFDAKRGGRVHLEWDRGATGSFEWISVRRDGDRVFQRTRPKAAHGDVTFRLRRGGSYTISVHFATRVSERAIPVGETLTKRTHFRVVADYRG